MIYVLIVESDPQVLQAVEDMIRAPTCRTVGVLDEPRAVDVLSNVAFDVMIVGLTPTRPNFDKLIFFANENYPALRIFAGTAQARDTRYARIVDAYLTHPLSLNEIEAAMSRCECKYCWFQPA